MGIDNTVTVTKLHPRFCGENVRVRTVDGGTIAGLLVGYSISAKEGFVTDVRLTFDEFGEVRVPEDSTVTRVSL